MRRSLVSLLGLLSGCFFAPSAASAQDPIDLLADVRYRNGWQVSAYNPRVEPEVRCIRSHDEATLFCAAAWDEEKDALHIDFAKEQIVVVAWGALRWAEGSAGAGVTIYVEQATISDGTLHLSVRTVIPPGKGIDIGPDQPGRDWYPSRFIRTPRTDRVEVDIIGSRRRKPAADFRPVATKDLEVRVAPDASPSRELMSIVPPEATRGATTPQMGLFKRGDQEVLEVVWGEFGPGSYRLELVGTLIDRGVARLTLRAENRAIMLYSGPGVHTPSLAVALPPVEKVLLHIERVGQALPATETDFEVQTGNRLDVTVDKSSIRP